MKFSFSFLLFTLLSITIKAQSKSNLMVHAGLAVPIGDFGQKSINDQAGAAKPGFNGQFLYTYEVIKNLRLGAMVSGRVNVVDAEAIGKATNSVVHTTSWTSFSFLGGLIRHFDLPGSSGSFLLRGFLGPQLSSSPRVTIANARQKPYNATSLAGLFGIGREFRISENGALQINVDAGLTTAKFYDRAISSSPLFKQEMNTIDIGVSYRP